MPPSFTTVPGPSTAVCAGCNRSFRSLSGFHSHLRQRRNDERCLATYHGYLAGLESLSESDSSESDSESESELMDIDDISHQDWMDCDFEEAEEDAVGGVQGETIEGIPDPRGHECSHQGSDPAGDNENDDNIQGGDGDPAGDDDNDDDILPESSRTADYRHQAERVLVDTGDGPKPHTIIRYTTKHGHSRAGSIITHANTHDDQYASTINSNDNVWAPFGSKVDWEMARWAKMRGPGSTALTELLSIEGVSTQLDSFAVQ